MHQWLIDNPQEWRDLKEEMELCLHNAISMLKSRGCKDRDFFAGKCNGIEECIDLDKNLI